MTIYDDKYFKEKKWYAKIGMILLSISIIFSGTFLIMLIWNVMGIYKINYPQAIGIIFCVCAVDKLAYTLSLICGFIDYRYGKDKE